ncbi:uncharacterized protein LOC133333983, partial [Musca vetustissima]|uniref:uncharacterized protein LOC133333983 n=1 Tax=Musca vetustissima TaxID=27455 RepID=UPI002AB6FA5F
MSKCRKEGDWFYTESKPLTLKTTTHEMLEAEQKNSAKSKIIGRKQLNFQSYPMNDFRFNLMRFNEPQILPLTTSYRRDYAPPFPSYPCKPKTKDESIIPDPLFNRKPPSEFGMRQTSKFKFMDDQFVNLSESRKKINFMRQM